MYLSASVVAVSTWGAITSARPLPLPLPLPNAQNLLPKICTKSPITRLVREIDQICLGLPGGFRGWPIQWNHAKCKMLWADPCGHGNEISDRRGDPVAYRLVYLFPITGSYISIETLPQNTRQDCSYFIARLIQKNVTNSKNSICVKNSKFRLFLYTIYHSGEVNLRSLTLKQMMCMRQ